MDKRDDCGYFSDENPRNLSSFKIIVTFYFK